MRRIATCAAALLLVAGVAPLYAKGDPGGGKPATAGAHSKAPKTPPAKGGPKSTTASGGAATSAHGKSTAPGQTKKTTTTPTTGATADAAAVGPTVPKNAKLREKLAGKIGGMNLEDAAEGFKNQGQFIAAVHAADRLDVDFADFKAKMVGTEGESLSLGQTIHFFKPEADADAEVEIAESQARQDLK